VEWESRIFDAALAATGLDGLAPHELRHTAASLAMARAASVKAVQRMLGHRSASMTPDVYGHLFEGDLDAVAKGLHAARRVPPGVSRRDRDPTHTGLASG
jgi:integrase